MRPVHCAALLSVVLALPVLAKLPALSDDAKAKAADAAAKAAWADKVGAYQLCRSQDKVAESYRKSGKASAPAAVQTAAPASGATPAPVTIAACADPGPYVAVTPAAAKPIEASEAHSPAGTATSPPSTNATSAQISPKK